MNSLTPTNEVLGDDTKPKAQPDLAQASIAISQPEKKSLPDSITTTFLPVSCGANNMFAVEGSEGVSAQKPAKPLNANRRKDSFVVRAT